MSARTLAERLALRRVGRDWRGDCPICCYANSFTLSETRQGLPLLWCASCTDREGFTALLRGTGCCPPPAPARAPERPSDADRTASALALWERAMPAGSIVGAYFASRGLHDRVPDDVRFLPAHLHRETRHTGPVMLAAVRDAGGRLRALHRTWLKPDGSGKAPVTPQKKTLGPCTGCAVRLHPADDAVIVAEGIETALSASLLFDLPAWACLSAGGLESLILPARVASVLIAADHDVNGVGQRAAETLARRLAAEGRSVRIAVPDEPGTDFNDVLLAREVCNG